MWVCIVFTPGLLRSVSNSKLMHFNIFMNFDREFSTRWQNKAPLFATLSLAPKICIHWVSYNHCPCDQPSDSTNPRDVSEGEGCVLCQLCPGRQVFEMRKHSAVPQGRGTEALYSTKAHLSSPVIVRCTHNYFYHVCVCIRGGCAMLQGFNHLFSDRFALSSLFATCAPSQRRTTFSTRFFR